MGADEDVDLARSEVGEHGLDLCGLAEPRDHVDVYREVAIAIAEGIPVLLCEDRRGAEHEHLLAVDGDRERGSHGDLRLAEPHVAADEPVHRARRLEIFLDSLDRAGLVVGLTVRERGLEPLEPLAGEIEGHPLGPLALRIELQELAGELSDRRSRPRLEVLPRLAAELRERRRFRICPDVARELAELLVRDEEAVFALEGEVQVVAGDAGDRLRLEPEQLADALILVDDVVADPEVGEACERASEPCVGSHRLLSEDLGLGKQDEPELAPHEATPDRSDREPEHGVGAELVVDLERFRSNLAKQCPLSGRLAAMREPDDDAVSGADEAGELVLGFGEPTGSDRWSLRLERVGLSTWERVELCDGVERDRRKPFLLPDRAHLVRLPHEVGNAV